MCGVRVWRVFSKLYIFNNFIRSVISQYHSSPPHPQEFSLSSLHLTVREMEGPLFQDTASVIAIGNVPVLSFARWEHYTVVQLVPVEHTLDN